MDQYHDHCRDQQPGSHYDSGWKFIKSYWRSKQHFPAYIFLSIVLCLTVSLVTLDFIFNYWYYTYFYNALQTYNKHGLVHLLSFFFILSICYLVLALHRYIVSRLISRQWLGNPLINYLLLKYIRLSNDVKKRKNNKYMQKNISVFINSSLDFTMGLVIAITTFSAFMYYLCLLMDEIASQFRLPDITNYFIATGLLFAVGVTIYLLKRKYHLQPISLESSLQGITHQPVVTQLTSDSLSRNGYLILLQKNLPLWLLAGHSLIYVIFSLLLILPSYIEQLYLFLAVIYSLQTFLRGQHLFLFRFSSYFKK